MSPNTNSDGAPTAKLGVDDVRTALMQILGTEPYELADAEVMGALESYYREFAHRTWPAESPHWLAWFTQELGELAGSINGHNGYSDHGPPGLQAIQTHATVLAAHALRLANQAKFERERDDLRRSRYEFDDGFDDDPPF